MEPLRNNNTSGTSHRFASDAQLPSPHQPAPSEAPATTAPTTSSLTVESATTTVNPDLPHLRLQGATVLAYASAAIVHPPGTFFTEPVNPFMRAHGKAVEGQVGAVRGVRGGGGVWGEGV